MMIRDALDDILHSLCLYSVKRFGNFAKDFEEKFD